MCQKSCHYTHSLSSEILEIPHEKKSSQACSRAQRSSLTALKNFCPHESRCFHCLQKTSAQNKTASLICSQSFPNTGILASRKKTPLLVVLFWYYLFLHQLLHVQEGAHSSLGVCFIKFHKQRER